MNLNQLPLPLREELARLDHHYDIDLRELNRGANGYVFFAKNRITTREVAIKFYPVEADGAQHREPQLLAQLRSPNVLEIQDARAISADWAFFLTPRCDGGDLNDLLARGVSAVEALDVAMSVCHGVSALHGADLVHRDLKPDNIVMDVGVPKLADFGSVRLLPDGVDTVPASHHTLLYRPPESHQNGVHGKAGDVYQVGVVTYQLLGGSLSYDLRSHLSKAELREVAEIQDTFDADRFIDAVVMRRTTSGKLLDFNTLPPWGRPARRVLRQMTAADPGQRYASISEAAIALQAVRGKMANWRRTAVGAKLQAGSRVVELRQVGTDRFEAFVDLGKGFRRASGVGIASLEELVATF